MTSPPLDQDCPGCGVRLPEADGPRHPYMTCSSACWYRYGELLDAQYSDPKRMRFHQLIVDAYAISHPGGDDPRAVQSVCIHLMTLCLFLEHDTDPVLGARLHRRMVRRPVFWRLEPPARRGHLTMLSVPLNGDPSTAKAAAFSWALDAWTAWCMHHPTVHTWLTESGMTDVLPPKRDAIRNARH